MRKDGFVPVADLIAALEEEPAIRRARLRVDQQMVMGAVLAQGPAKARFELCRLPTNIAGEGVGVMCARVVQGHAANFVDNASLHERFHPGHPLWQSTFYHGTFHRCITPVLEDGLLAAADQTGAWQLRGEVMMGLAIDGSREISGIRTGTEIAVVVDALKLFYCLESKGLLLMLTRQRPVICRAVPADCLIKAFWIATGQSVADSADPADAERLRVMRAKVDSSGWTSAQAIDHHLATRGEGLAEDPVSEDAASGSEEEVFGMRAIAAASVAGSSREVRIIHDKDRDDLSYAGDEFGDDYEIMERGGPARPLRGRLFSSGLEASCPPAKLRRAGRSFGGRLRRHPFS